MAAGDLDFWSGELERRALAVQVGTIKGERIMGLLFAFMLMGVPILFAVFDLSQNKS